MSRIRHATETFVNNLIEGIKKLIASNTEQINVLSTNKAEKKYVDEQDLKSMNYKALIDNTRLYMTTQTGIYLTPASGVTDLPEGWAQGRHTLVCFNPNNDLYGFQLITTYAGSSGIGNNRKFAIRHAITEGSKWLELANTEKTDILCTPSSGYKITSQGSCVINNIVYLSITIEKSDGGIIPQNALVAIVPSAYKPTNGLKSADSVTLAGTSVNGVASCLVSTTGNIQYTGTATNTTKLLINTQYVI